MTSGTGLGGGARSRGPQTGPEQKRAAGPGPPDGAAAAPALGPAPRRKPPRREPPPAVLGTQLDEGLVKEVEVLTRGQRTNEDWFAWRRNRITASLAPAIARCRFSNGKSGALPSTYLAAIKGRPRPLLTWASAGWLQSPSPSLIAPPSCFFPHLHR